MSNELYHYNQNHDKLGRFTFSRGGGGIRVYKTIATPQKKKQMTTDELTSEVRRMNLEKQYDKLTKELKPKSKAENALTAVKSANEGLNQLKNAKRERDRIRDNNRPRLDLSKMSDQELRNRINREMMERQYNQLFNHDNVSRGKIDVDRMLNLAGAVLGVGGSALAIAVSIQQLRR